jgi:hypothetical protein
MPFELPLGRLAASRGIDSSQRVVPCWRTPSTGSRRPGSHRAERSEVSRFKIEARPLGDHVRFFAQVAAGTPCAQPPMVMRAQICLGDIRGRAGPRCRCALIPRMTPVAAWTSGSTARSAAPIRDPWPIAIESVRRAMAAARLSRQPKP